MTGDALGLGVGLDGGAAARVERVDEEDGCAVGDGGLGLRLHRWLALPWALSIL